MDEIKGSVWGGAINVQVVIDQSLLVRGSIEEIDKLVNVRIPRNSYLSMYTDSILSSIKVYLKKDIPDIIPHVWFEDNNCVLLWNIPVGTLFDTMNHTADYSKGIWQNDNSIQVWKINLIYGSDLPPLHIPVVGGLNQIEKYWMHQWKQACFILNGTSKQIMSLAMKDTKSFWESVLHRDYNSFSQLSAKIIPSRPRHVPIIIHFLNRVDSIVQPLTEATNKDGSDKILIQVVSNLIQEGRDNDNVKLNVICQGIYLPHDVNIYGLYLRFASFDGFLHLILSYS